MRYDLGMALDTSSQLTSDDSTDKTKYILVAALFLIILGGLYYFVTAKEQSTPKINKDLTTYVNQSLQKKDNKVVAAADKVLSKSSWIKATDNVWKDVKTGLYWSNDLGVKTNSFTIANCAFYTSTPRSSYNGEDSDCGKAINYCGNLSLKVGANGTEKNDWYLPSQEEQIQAYMDSMNRNTDVKFTTPNYFWSSTEVLNDSTNAWDANLVYGFTDSRDKNSSSHVRCIRRD